MPNVHLQISAEVAGNRKLEFWSRDSSVTQGPMERATGSGYVGRDTTKSPMKSTHEKTSQTLIWKGLATFNFSLKNRGDTI